MLSVSRRSLCLDSRSSRYGEGLSSAVVLSNYGYVAFADPPGMKSRRYLQKEVNQRVLRALNWQLTSLLRR
jgi:hypothetical protein